MRAVGLGLFLVALATPVAPALTAAQAPAAAPAPQRPSTPAGTTTATTSAASAPRAAAVSGVEVPPGYVIGIQDSFDVVVWKDKDMSAENVVVRPDGKISLPLINDIDAVGLTVEQLRTRITEAATKFVQEPEISVVVKTINSRRVSITGQVAKPAQYALLSRMTVVELISMAGGVAEYADKKNIRITRIDNGKTQSFLFNFKEFLQGKPKALEQNIELKPGDIVTVP